MKILSFLLGMSYNMSKMLSSDFRVIALQLRISAWVSVCVCEYVTNLVYRACLLWRPAKNHCNSLKESINGRVHKDSYLHLSGLPQISSSICLKCNRTLCWHCLQSKHTEEGSIKRNCHAGEEIVEKIVEKYLKKYLKKIVEILADSLPSCVSHHLVPPG